MKFLKGFLPNFTISANVALLIVIYLDMRNPLMGFLVGTPFQVLIGLCCASSIATAVTLYASWRKKGQKKYHEDTESKKIQNPS